MDAGVGALQIDCREWLVKYPQLKNYRIEVMPPTGDFYFAVTTMKDGILTWHLSQADTLAAGDGRFQVVAIGDNGERKTSDHPVMSVVDIIPGTANENPPDGFEVWADKVAQNAGVAEQAAETAEQAADRAEAAVSSSGYVFFEVNDAGHLIMTKTESVSNLDFRLNNGRLEAIYG